MTGRCTSRLPPRLSVAARFVHAYLAAAMRRLFRFFQSHVIGVAFLCFLAGGPSTVRGFEIGGLVSATHTALPVAGTPR